MSAVEKRVNMREVFPFLLKDFLQLTDEEIVWLLDMKEQIRDELEWLSRSVSFRLEQVQRYHARKKELACLSDEELRQMQSHLQKLRSAAASEGDNFWEDGSPDSIYEPPRLDSDENIIFELLSERKGSQ